MSDIIDINFHADNPFRGISPLRVINAWFDEAGAHEINDPTAMAIATIGADGYPQNRMVLCRGVNRKGVIFYTNIHSDKGQSLRQDPKIAALFHWKSLRRQIRLVGVVTRVDKQANQTYFSSRATVSQLGAWASKQSQPLDCRATLEQRLQIATEKYGDCNPIPCPDFWGGFLIVVEKVEFWCDGKHRLHNRFVLTRNAAHIDLGCVDGWAVQRLYP